VNRENNRENIRLHDPSHRFVPKSPACSITCAEIPVGRRTGNFFCVTGK
jgi:hypothetical protein